MPLNNVSGDTFFNFVTVESFFFDQDKNYLLKKAQQSSSDVLMEKWVLQSINAYMELHNPMGLVDDFVRSIMGVTRYKTAFLEESYDFLAAGYRLLYSSNQLEFLWDGKSHLQKYQEEWENQFNHWIYGLTRIDAINRPIIRACVLKDDSSMRLMERNFSRSVLKELELKWDGRRKSLVKAA